MDPQNPSPLATANDTKASLDKVISEGDILSIVDNTNLTYLDDVFIQLDVRRIDIDNAQRRYPDPNTYSRTILYLWHDRNGDSATRGAFLEGAMKVQNYTASLDILKRIWNIGKQLALPENDVPDWNETLDPPRRRDVTVPRNMTRLVEVNGPSKEMADKPLSEKSNLTWKSMIYNLLCGVLSFAVRPFLNFLPTCTRLCTWVDDNKLLPFEVHRTERLHNDEHMSVDSKKGETHIKPCHNPSINNSSEEVPSGVSSGESHINYKLLTYKVKERFEEDDKLFQKVIWLYTPGSNIRGIKYHKSKDMEPYQFLESLEESGYLSDQNLEYLYKILITVKQKDLACDIKHYQELHAQDFLDEQRPRRTSARGTFNTEIVVPGDISNRSGNDVIKYKDILQERTNVPKSAISYIGNGRGCVVLVFQLPLRWPDESGQNEDIDVRRKLKDDVSQRADWLMDSDVIGIHIEGQDYVDLIGISLKDNPKCNTALAADAYYYSYATKHHYNLIVSRRIDHRGGKLITKGGAALTFPKNAVWGTIQASMSTCLSDFPPMRFDQILMAMVMQCGPPGCFNEPALLEIPHSAKFEEKCKGKDVEVWCKTTDSVSQTDTDWVKVFADGNSIDPDIEVTVLPVTLLISTLHFTRWGLLSGRPTDMSVLMFINSPTFSEQDTMVDIKVLVVLPAKVKQVCDAEKKRKWHQCCSPTMYEVKANEKPLHVTISDISPLATWKCLGSNSCGRNAFEEKIPYIYLQKGSSKCEFTFTKKKSSACHIRGSFNIYQDDNEFKVTKTYFDSTTIIPSNKGDPRKRNSSGQSSGVSSAGMLSEPGSGMSRPPQSPYMPPSVKSSMKGLKCSNPKDIDTVLTSTPVYNKQQRNISMECDAQKRLECNYEEAGLENRGDIPKDGNCFFHVISDQLSLCGFNKTADQLRKSVIDYLRSNSVVQGPNGLINFKQYIVSSAPHANFDEYLNYMAKDGTWADGLVVFAMAHMLQRHILIVTSSPQGQGDNTLCWVIADQKYASKTPLQLGHIWENHYLSLQIKECSDLLKNPATSPKHVEKEDQPTSLDLGGQPFDDNLIFKMEMVSIASKELKFGDVIGSGGEGSVFKGEWGLVKNGMEEIQEVAIKKLSISSDLSELKTLSELSHPNIINVFGFVEEHHEVCIVMELCQYSLRGYFERNPSPLSGENLLRWSLEAALPLEYLRRHNILHRDVKPENYLVNSGMVLKLSDFGLARKLDCTVSKVTQVGTLRWMAPEVCGVTNRSFLSPSYDIFALGLLLWYLVARKMPYDEYHHSFAIAQAIINGQRPIIPAECPLKLADLMQQCWSYDYKDRPGISQIIFHIKDMIASLETTDNLSHLRMAPARTLSTK